jgi:hypothetical protein
MNFEDLHDHILQEGIFQRARYDDTKQYKRERLRGGISSGAGGAISGGMVGFSRSRASTFGKAFRGGGLVGAGIGGALGAGVGVLHAKAKSHRRHEEFGKTGVLGRHEMRTELVKHRTKKEEGFLAGHKRMGHVLKRDVKSAYAHYKNKK